MLKPCPASPAVSSQPRLTAEGDIGGAAGMPPPPGQALERRYSGAVQASASGSDSEACGRAGEPPAAGDENAAPPRAANEQQALLTPTDLRAVGILQKLALADRCSLLRCLVGEEGVSFSTWKEVEARQVRCAQAAASLVACVL